MSNSIRNAVHKLHAVTLVRSGIGRPRWEKKTLKALSLDKLHKTVIHKNTATVNSHLASVKGLIKVQPVVFRNDMCNSPTGNTFFLDNAQFFVPGSLEAPTDEESSEGTTNKDRQKPYRPLRPDGT